MKYICALLVVMQLAWAGSAASAQQYDLGADVAPPTGGQAGAPGQLGPGGGLPEPGSDALQPIPESIDIGDADVDEFEGSILGEPLKMLTGHAPFFESSGTWLRRGYWFAEVDYWMMTRSWDKHGVVLASEEAVRNSHPSGAPFLVSNVLELQGDSEGAEGLGRVKLGRFLFRDMGNRDHFVEASWWGGGSYEQAVSLESSTNAGLQVSNFIDRVNVSFDGAEEMSFAYQSEINSAELNYEVRQRMDRDQLLLHPGGAWVRSAAPTRTYSYLAGIRYVNLRENLAIDSVDNEGTANTDESGFYDVMTENNLLGTQVGGSISHETGRWSLTASAKGGLFWNRMDLNSSFQVGEDTVRSSGDTNSDKDSLAFVGDAELLGRWYLRPNVSLRASLGLMWIDSIALAPHQVHFIPGQYSPIADTGDSVFLGGSLGVEGYW